MRLSLLRLIQPTRSSSVFRWDQLFLIAANDEAAEISDHITSIQTEEIAMPIVFLNPGDTLLVENWSVLHGLTSTSEKPEWEEDYNE